MEIALCVNSPGDAAALCHPIQKPAISYVEVLTWSSLHHLPRVYSISSFLHNVTCISLLSGLCFHHFLTDTSLVKKQPSENAFRQNEKT